MSEWLRKRNEKEGAGHYLCVCVGGNIPLQVWMACGLVFVYIFKIILAVMGGRLIELL